MQWTDIAQFVGPTPNETPSGMEQVIGVVLHIQQGNQAGSISWCKNPASQVSAHFFAPKIGRPQQLVDTADMAWAQMAGNAHWLSIENEGYSGQDLSPDQIEACAQICARAYQVYRIPLVLTDNPDVGGLGWHGMGGPAWGAHPDCPGIPVQMQRGHILARALQLVGAVGVVTPPIPPRGAPAWPGRYFVYPPVDGTDVIGADVQEWQTRMRWRGWTITIDGFYGPQSANVCGAFQADSAAHGWYLQRDGIVGPLTWSAAWERPVSTP